jgi:hypothetical protein
MPIELGQGNHMIDKRIVSKWGLKENKRSDTSRYRETKKLALTSLGRKKLSIQENWHQKPAQPFPLKNSPNLR